MKLIAGVCAAMAISAVGLMTSTYAAASAFAGLTADKPADEQTQEITMIGCVRAWKPASSDVTRMPENREPGMSGMFVLTPLVSGPTTAIELPSYLLTPSATANYQQHLDRKVEVVGVPQTAPLAPTVRVVVTAPQLPENRPDAQSFPRLTVRSIRRLGDTCPS